MKQSLNSYLLELESKIQILELENETLSAKAEENLLLNRAFEEINVYEDMDSLLLNTLESISVLLNIQFSGLFVFQDNSFICISSYALFSNEDTVNIRFSISENNANKLASNQTLLLYTSDHGLQFEYPKAAFFADHAVIIPLDSELIKRRYFVFVNDKNGTDLADRIPLFEKVIRIISAKLERIYYQNELQKLNAELEEKVELRTLELFSQNQEYLALNEEYKTINEELLIAIGKAEESDRLKTAFIQNLSHEIRTPLNGIMGFSSLLVDSYDDKEKLVYFSEIINQQGQDLLDIINDILDISKIESGQLAVNISDCNMPELMDELQIFFKEYRKRFGKENIDFKLECFCEPSQCVLKTDKGKLKQILINLVGNALKFTQKGSVQCTCSFEDDYLQFQISDTGSGMPKDKLSKVFERFVQIHNSAVKNVGGTGLGLPIAKALVKTLGGDIWVESEIDKGSTFYFTIKQSMVDL